MCIKLANLNQQTLIRSHFKLCNLYRINYLCSLITLHIGLSPSLGANPYTITYLCNLTTLQIGLFPSLGPNPHAMLLSLQPGIIILRLSLSYKVNLIQLSARAIINTQSNKYISHNVTSFINIIINVYITLHKDKLLT